MRTNIADATYRFHIILKDRSLVYPEIERGYSVFAIFLIGCGGYLLQTGVIVAEDAGILGGIGEYLEDDRTL